MPTIDPLTGLDDLPNEIERLKARIQRQTILLGLQLIEIDELRDQLRAVKRQNHKLRALLTPTN
ncbi:hypothetical protein GCM10028806_34880 [Spirosoma terrae]|uniref:Uncharacterized protein n=1 Tax=Spirosoma terrae TaxID=1968276 RepID=A0A6L9L9J8_9BACT|nr:hypothetical protein [Spirosoma terrae]NDU95801.1 hypothetical protein [Spirosoma terrae]